MPETTCRRCAAPGCCRLVPHPKRKCCSRRCASALAATAGRAADPTPAEVAERAAAVRARWTEWQEQRRLACRPREEWEVPCCRVLGDVLPPEEDRCR